MIQLLLAMIYLSFISLGLPDSLLGSAWPVMYTDFGVPVAYAGIISMIISGSTIISSLQSDRLTRRFGTGKVTVVSVALTAAALLGFSYSGSFWQLCLWAIPYGLGAGSVDTSLNNYVALHYSSRHMSWLHCMWGVGASLGPYVMSYALMGGQGWSAGYLYIAVAQIALTTLLLISLPLWRAGERALGAREGEGPKRALTLKEVLALPGTWEVALTFFCYCALEQTAGLWAGSYLTLHGGLSKEAAAGYAGLFYLGITAGRALSGFVTMKLSDEKMVRLGQGIIAVGIITLLLPLGRAVLIAGLILIGLGCAPIYPCIIHSTPRHFGAANSQAVIGVQMASAYAGTLAMPPLFGVLAQRWGAGLLPAYLIILLLLTMAMHEMLLKKTAGG